MFFKFDFKMLKENRLQHEAVTNIQDSGKEKLVKKVVKV